MSNALEPLSLEERKGLAACEMVVSQGLDAFIAVGQALADIRDRRLYRQTHKTFEDYCRSKWNIGKSHAYRLTQAAEIAADLSPIGDVSNEAHARALAAFPPHLREQIFRRALDTAPETGLTAAHIMRCGNELSGLWEQTEADEEEDEADDEAQDEAYDDDAPEDSGEALSDAADRCTEPALHPVEKAADHFRKGGKDLKHATDLDIGHALRLHGQLTAELARLLAQVKGRKQVTAKVVD